jgi:hypothetical protein
MLMSWPYSPITYCVSPAVIVGSALAGAALRDAGFAGDLAAAFFTGALTFAACAVFLAAAAVRFVGDADLRATVAGFFAGFGFADAAFAGVFAEAFLAGAFVALTFLAAMCLLQSTRTAPLSARSGAGCSPVATVLPSAPTRRCAAPNAMLHPARS